MADNIFTDIAAGIPKSIAPHHVIAAREWFRQAAQDITRINPNTLFKQMAQNLLTNINISSIGSMYMFHYDPKWKDILPWYDTYPLIFMVELYNDGFSGINLHYLPPYHRAKLMDALYGITLKHKDTMKIQISYDILNNARRFRLFKHCYKRYLTTHLQSKLLFIEPSKWDTALMLPLQRFHKASEEQVWAQVKG